MPRNAVPAEYGDLGLPQAQFERHIAYDIGARDLTLGLAARLGGTGRAVALLAPADRPQPGLDDPTLIMRISDGAVVPGNARWTRPSGSAASSASTRPITRRSPATIAAVQGRGLVPLLVSIHSFTPVWRGWPRPWHVGILWDRDEAVAQRHDPRLPGAG